MTIIKLEEVNHVKLRVFQSRASSCAPMDSTDLDYHALSELDVLLVSQGLPQGAPNTEGITVFSVATGGQHGYGDDQRLEEKDFFKLRMTQAEAEKHMKH